jgi:hypothetical protein
MGPASRAITDPSTMLLTSVPVMLRSRTCVSSTDTNTGRMTGRARSVNTSRPTVAIPSSSKHSSTVIGTSVALHASPMLALQLIVVTVTDRGG